MRKPRDMRLLSGSSASGLPRRRERRSPPGFALRAATLAVGILTAVVACGGKAAQEPLDLDMRGQRHDMRHGDPPACATGQPCPAASAPESGEMAHMPPALARFHETLAPRWHAPHGPERMANTCSAIATFRADADAIVAAPPPDGGDRATWSAGGQQLTEAVAALDATCQAKDAAAFVPAFERVHQAFHHLLEAAKPPGAHHDEPGEPGEPDEHGKPGKDER